MCGGAGREPCGQAASPTAAPPASLATLTVRAVGSEEGALGSFKVIALSPWDPGFPDSSSSLLRNLILGGGEPKGPRDFVLSRPHSKLLGSPGGGASAG